MSLAQRVAEYPWILRAAWASGKPVSIRFEESPIEVRQHRGWVVGVAVTGSFALLQLARDKDTDEPFHLPLDERIVAVTLIDHFSESGLRRRPRLRYTAPPVDPDQLSLDFPPEQLSLP